MVICDDYFSVDLDMGESYSYNSMISAPTIYDIRGKENINVDFKYGPHTYRCINVTLCNKEYGQCGTESVSVILITITSIKNNNVITSKTLESECSSVYGLPSVLTIILLMCLCACCCLMTFCHYKQAKLPPPTSEMVPLLRL